MTRALIGSVEWGRDLTKMTAPFSWMVLDQGIWMEVQKVDSFTGRMMSGRINHETCLSGLKSLKVRGISSPSLQQDQKAMQVTVETAASSEEKGSSVSVRMVSTSMVTGGRLA